MSHLLLASMAKESARKWLQNPVFFFVGEKHLLFFLGPPPRVDSTMKSWLAKPVAGNNRDPTQVIQFAPEGPFLDLTRWSQKREAREAQSAKRMTCHLITYTLIVTYNL